MEYGKTWKPFCGCDSLSLEEARTALLNESVTNPDIEREVVVRGDMYLVVLHAKESATLKPIYWEGKSLNVLIYMYCVLSLSSSSHSSLSVPLFFVTSLAKLCPVLRGSWFEVITTERWVPLSEEEAELLEEAHTRKDWRERVRGF